MRLYRITKNDPPVTDDMQSHWDLGRRPARSRDEAAYKEVSVFETPEAAARKARQRGLGAYLAELEISDEFVTSRNPVSGHVGLSGTTPEQFLDCVQSTIRVDDV